ncbi:MAG TPA: acylphosphatase, partial [bacterium]|nr:acylphosphatase [bacterium]
MNKRLHIQVRGIVQGVGFRPFVYNLAREKNLSGFVGNDSEGVFIEVQGNAGDLEAFRDILHQNPPPLSA